MLTRLERAELQRRVSKNAEEPKMWTGPCYCVGDRVGAVGYLTEELSYYNTEVSGCAVLCCRRFSFRLGFGGGGGGELPALVDVVVYSGIWRSGALSLCTNLFVSLIELH